MAVPAAKIQPWAQLLRLPNLFTAVADPLAGWLIRGSPASPQLALILGASGCLYAAGLVLNDCFDQAEDGRERPERPLPSGRIAPRAAWWTGLGLLLTGLILAVLAERALTGVSLAALILFYNAWGKRSAITGLPALALCRFGNFQLGLDSLVWPLWLAPAILAVYVAGLAALARREALQPALQKLVRWLLLNLIVLDALLVCLFGPNCLAALVVLALFVPAWLWSKFLKMT